MYFFFTLKSHGQNWLGSLADNTEIVKKNAVPKSSFLLCPYVKCICVGEYMLVDVQTGVSQCPT